VYLAGLEENAESEVVYSAVVAHYCQILHAAVAKRLPEVRKRLESVRERVRE
jgi:hypothetical protein